ncbi:MAG: S8 family serine peptidase [Firmicutes bacterium]|nr:S8 family serine peptidase [Bacillota bacterium]
MRNKIVLFSVLGIWLLGLLVPFALSAQNYQKDTGTKNIFHEFSQEFMTAVSAIRQEYWCGDFSVDKASRYQTRQLVVKANGHLNDKFGAIKYVSEDNFYVLQYETIDETRRASKLFSRERNVVFSEPNKIITHTNPVLARQNSASFLHGDRWGSERIYSDQFIELLYELDRDLTTEIRVAVIDTGLNIEHEMFQGRVHGGFDVINNTNVMTDPNGHGTHVAGTIVDNTPDNVMIVPFNVFPESMITDSLSIQNAIARAITANVSVINMSLGARTQDAILYNSIRSATNLGIVVVAAAGNDSLSPADFPARYPHVIGVAASDRDDNPAYFSHYGVGVDIAAPGWEILSAWRHGPSGPHGYAWSWGTSMAAPHVSAIAALLLIYTDAQIEPGTNTMIRNKILDIAYSPNGWDNNFGAGIATLSILIDRHLNPTDGGDNTQVGTPPPDTSVTDQGSFTQDSYTPIFPMEILLLVIGGGFLLFLLTSIIWFLSRRS